MPRNMSWQAASVLSRPPVNMTSCESCAIFMVVSPPRRCVQSWQFPVLSGACDEFRAAAAQTGSDAIDGVFRGIEDSKMREVVLADESAA